jgi:hypothetical protein
MTDGEMNRPGSPSVIAKVVAEALTEHRRFSRIAQVTGLPISTCWMLLLITLNQARSEQGKPFAGLGP